MADGPSSAWHKLILTLVMCSVASDAWALSGEGRPSNEHLPSAPANAVPYTHTR